MNPLTFELTKLEHSKVQQGILSWHFEENTLPANDFGMSLE